jgi:hypothetical protein
MTNTLSEITRGTFVSLALTLADDEHPEHEFGIDRRSAGLTVEWLQLLAKVSQHARHNRIDPAQEMARRNALFDLRG